MNDKINNICKLEFASITQINEFLEASSGHVLINATWTDIPIIPGASVLITKEPTKAGRRYGCDFSGKLRAILDLHPVGIFRLTMDNEDLPLIIGDPDLPVRTSESIALREKIIRFTHEGWHYPWSFAGVPETGSGSDGGGI